jgi:hypothetical protein
MPVCIEALRGAVALVIGTLPVPPAFLPKDSNSNLSPAEIHLIWLGALLLVLIAAVMARARSMEQKASRLKEKQLTLRNLDAVLAPKHSSIKAHDSQKAAGVERA